MGPRFALYARGIQTIALNPHGPETEENVVESTINRYTIIRPDVMDGWVQYQAGTSTFPNLQTLKFWWAATTAETVRALTGSALRKLEVHSFAVPVPGSMEYEYIINFLPVACPALYHLEIFAQQRSPADHNPALPPFVPPLSRFSHLTTILLCIPIGPALLRLLASLPHLRTLDMNAPSSIPPSLPGAFPSLRALHLSFCALPAAAALLSLLTTPTLQDVSVTTPAGSAHRTSAHYLPFTHALARFPKLERINACRRGRREAYEEPIAEHTPLQMLLAPLFGLERLRAINLNLGQMWAGDDGLLEKMSRAWPALETLRLSLPVHCFLISLEAYAATLRALPQLKYFNLAVDICTPIPSRDAWPPPNAALHLFELAPSEHVPDDYNVVPLGDFLRAVSPNVRCAEDISWGHLRSTQGMPDHMFDALDTYLSTGEAPRLDDENGE